jgi:trans-AT polyketide synthase/acyltransferase/oxidoreductase domain-containing protein
VQGKGTPLAEQRIGVWSAGNEPPAFTSQHILDAAQRVRELIHVVINPETKRMGVAFSGKVITEKQSNGNPTFPLIATLPAMYPEWLGNRSFCEVHRVRFPYVTGAMANGIATTQLVTEMARANMLGFFGAAGLSLHRIEAAIDELENALGRDGPTWGSNLIHSPAEPELEAGCVDLYLRRGVRRVSASAYMSLTPHVVRYGATGLHVGPTGVVRRRNHVFAKISRPEVAKHFMMPAPKAMLDNLVSQGLLTAEEAQLAAKVPIAEDITVEADSGGHTDNQALTAVLPVILKLRDDICAAQGYVRPIRVGAAGGLGSPAALAAAYSLGADYVLTGSVNQSAVESGLSPAGRELLARAGLKDVMMAAAADMFELGVKLQVLKLGTMFGVRANKLYHLYSNYDSLEAIPRSERADLEKNILGISVAEVWSETQSYWRSRDPRENDKAAENPKHKMALCFRWYLGQSSRWANAGQKDRQMDYQIWCGPAMGAFNDWVSGSFLEQPTHRTVVQIAKNLLEGATVVTRAHQLRNYGVAVPSAAFQYRPRMLR